MIIPAATPKSVNQGEPDRRPRRERRQEQLELRRRQKKLMRKIAPVFLDAEFSNETVTAFGNSHLLETFKRSLNFKEIIQQHLSLKKGSNCVYATDEILDYLTDSCALGHTRFEHTECLRFDPGYKDLKGINRFPSEKVFRDFLGSFTNEHLQELCEINRSLIQLRSQWTGPREVWFDIDGTVITIFGEQEGGEVRYNPRYKGRRSFEMMVCFISETKELLYAELCAPDATPKSQFRDFLEKAKKILPANYVLKGVRLDKGFFAEKNINYLENNLLDYVAKVPLYQNVRTYLERIPEKQWENLTETIGITRKKLLLKSWEHDRYIDIRRSKVEKQTNQMTLPDSAFYRYEAILSSQLEQPPVSNFTWYDDRGTAEHYIKEIKDGFHADEVSQHQKIRNEAYAFIKIIAYNLLNFFKSAALPPQERGWQVQTLRRKLINIPANILGQRGNRRVKLAPNPYLENLLPLVKERLREFLWFVANEFEPLRCF